MKETLFARDVCACIIYASHTQDYRWRSRQAHMAEGCGYVTATRGPATSDCNRTGSKCTKGPHPHQHNIPLPDRTNYSASTPWPLPPPPQNKLALPHNQTTASAYALGAMVLLLRETNRGSAAWLLSWSYLFSSACHTLSYNLRPPPTPKPL